MKYKEVARRLKQMGCQEIPRKGGGSHRKWYNPAGGAITPIPDWGSEVRISKLGLYAKLFVN